MRSIVSSFFRY